MIEDGNVAEGIMNAFLLSATFWMTLGWVVMIWSR